MCLLALIFLRALLISSRFHFWWSCCNVWCLGFLSSLYILAINLLSHSAGGLFTRKTVSFAAQQLFNFMKSYLSNVRCVPCLERSRKIIERNLCLSCIQLQFSSGSLRVSGFMLWSLGNFELICVQLEGSNFVLLPVATSVSMTICSTGCLLSCVHSWLPSKIKQLFEMSFLGPLFHPTDLCVCFMPAPCCFILWLCQVW